MISNRAKKVDSSGIRKVFDLAAKLKSPINLSIGQPNFPAFDVVKQKAIEAINDNKSYYTPTQGNPELCEEISNRYRRNYNISNSKTFLTSGVSAGLFLSYSILLDPGDEVLIPDPFFCMYRDLAYMINAEPVYYDTYPDFIPKIENLESLVTARTKAIVINSPSNPTGYALNSKQLEDLMAFAKAKNLVVIYDEIYSEFVYDIDHVVPSFDNLIILNGFSKSAGVPGWRMAYVLAPEPFYSEMLKLQQYTFVCANSIGQNSLIAALDYDFSEHLASYKSKRDLIVEGLSGKYHFVAPGGAFYVFPEAPGGDANSFVEKCVENNLLVVPGNVFSTKDTHFRISFSASMETLEQGIEVLRKLV